MDARQPQQWVLRRIGPPPSIPEVADVAELKRGSTVFGRGPTADVFIDSRILKNFISRRHAVVVGEVGDDSQLHFTLYNHGLNGTYVNDVRVGEVHQLNEGDRVTFGHKNGVNVKVGETALQADSEFQYVLELAPLPRQPVVPVGEPVPPLGERLCQESNPSVTCLSEYDRSECHFFSPKISHAVSPDAQQEPSFSPSNKLKSSQPKPLFEVPSRSLQSKHSEGGASRSPRGGKTETIGAAKGVAGSRLPARRHSDDSVIKSTASNKDSDAVFSGSKTAAPEPSSPRQRPSGSCRPVPDTSRSPRPVRDRSRSPVSRRERSKSPRPVCSSSVSPVSPVSQRITRSRSRSPAPTHLLAGPKAKDPTPKEQETLLSGYDDPPVLTPESIARTPSPSYISQNEVDDEDFGENDIESDRESIGWEIPPTPGRSLGEASPYPHGHMTPHRRTIVPANAVYRSATHAAPKTVNRRSSTSGDETDFGGERQVGRSHLEKADCSGDRTGKEHTASAESKRTGVTSLFSEIQRTATSSSPARSKERGGAEPKAKVRRKSKDFVNDLSDNDDVFDNPSSSNHSSSRHSHGMGTGSESRRKIPKSSTEVSRTSHKPNKSLLEKENG
ncbi:hypothetical protein BaRGS_00014610 [Batillaria attramentaria]|uniref:FHA domain-containing protein n=1 Tax=Batillaria attramentaria TaxID=370345 RepID=A0ABD0L468_9CAEN